MARITVNVCLCSIIFLWQYSLPSFGSIVFHLHDLPISVDEALAIPETEQMLCGERSVFSWENLVTSDCRISDSTLITDQTTILPKSVATCPAESQAVKSQAVNIALPKCESELNGASLKPVWAAASRFVSSAKTIIIRSVRSTERRGIEICHWLGASATESMGSVSWSKVRETSVKSVKRLVPAVLISHPRTALNPDDEFSSESMDGEINETDSETDDETLFILPAETQDSYWQYYEDCDRWGVEFASLLIEAHRSQEGQAGDKVVIVQGESFVPEVTPHLSIARIIASQNVSTWLVPPPRIDSQPSFNLFRWLELVEFNAIESAETDFVLLASDSSTETAKQDQAQSRPARIGLVDEIERLVTSLNFVETVSQAIGLDQVGITTSR